jgi:tetratricopeptide (TPR) repeat protein
MLLQDSVIGGDVIINQNNAEDIAAAMVSALERMGFSGKSKPDELTAEQTKEVEEVLEISEKLVEHGIEIDPWDEYSLGSAAELAGRTHSAKRHYRQALEIYWENGDHGWESQSVLDNLLDILHGQKGDEEWAEEQRLHTERLVIARELGDRKGEAYALVRLGVFMTRSDCLTMDDVDQDDFAEAQRMYQESLLITRDIGDRSGEANALEGLARNAIHNKATEEFSEIELLIRESVTMRETIDVGDLWEILHNQQWQFQRSSVYRRISVAIEKGDQIEEQRLRQVALAISKGMGDQHDEVEQAQSTTGKKSTKMLKKLMSVFGRKPKNPGAPPPFPDPDAE